MDMRAGAVDDDCARILARLANAPGTPADSRMAEQFKQLGLLAVEAPVKKKEKIGESVPVVNAVLFLTQSCNLKCVYCYGDGGGYGAGGTMTESTAFRAVDWLIEQSDKMKKIHIGFFGGEPFLTFSLMRTVVAYAKKRAQETNKEVDFRATTNGTLLDDEIITFIREHAIKVTVSFDGPPEVQDVQRPFINGNGSYTAIVPGLKRLLAAMPDTPGHAVLTGTNDPQIIKAAMRAIGFSEVTVIPASASLFAGPGATMQERDMEMLFSQLEQEAQTWVNLISNRDSESLKDLKSKSQLRMALLTLLHNTKRRHACGAGLRMVAVSCMGDVYLCHRFVGQDEYKLGSVFARELDREKYSRSPATFIAACAACFARHYCAGGCKHDNASSCGSAFTPSEDVCRLRRRELEMAAVVVGGLDHADRVFLAEHNVIPAKPCPLDF